eukprot:TRINITY_DN60689_c0_g1_i1.p1 TRINITY_DN60689_c0_g1~~TRINITY_DN60689_c0_g1_i1.p1  ORF type:complete len:183 (-),score=15.48 TRINITY_DN60689_c0_g1_i1:822-1370(-)
MTSPLGAVGLDMGTCPPERQHKPEVREMTVIQALVGVYSCFALVLGVAIFFIDLADPCKSGVRSNVLIIAGLINALAVTLFFFAVAFFASRHSALRFSGGSVVAEIIAWGSMIVSLVLQIAVVVVGLFALGQLSSVKPGCSLSTSLVGAFWAVFAAHVALPVVSTVMYVLVLVGAASHRSCR